MVDSHSLLKVICEISVSALVDVDDGTFIREVGYTDRRDEIKRSTRYIWEGSKL